MEYSVVVPLFNEEKNVNILYDEIKNIMGKMGDEYEIVFIDDGSVDDTFQCLQELAKKDKSIVVIKFRRNFGQSAALSAGFQRTKGNIIISMDGDLQNNPADIPQLLNKLKEGYDVVSGWRRDRKDKMIVRKIPSKLANKLICHVTGIRLHDTGCSLKVYRKKIIKSISLYGELHRFIPALTRMEGASIEEIAVHHRERRYGKSKYNLTRTFKVLMDISTLNLFLKYIHKPEIYFGTAGIIFMITGLFTFFWFVAEMFAIDADPAEGNILLALTFLLIVTGFQFILYGQISRLIINTGYRRHYR